MEFSVKLPINNCAEQADKIKLCSFKIKRVKNPVLKDQNVAVNMKIVDCMDLNETLNPGTHRSLTLKGISVGSLGTGPK